MWGVVRIAATRQIENLKRSWKHFWQRTCANTTPTSAAKTKPLSTDPERTCQMVVRHVEDSQIDKVAKLLGKAAYRKIAIISTKWRLSDRVLSPYRRGGSSP